MAVPLFVVENERKRLYKRRILLEQIPEYQVRESTGLPSWGVREIINLFEPVGTKISSNISVESRILVYLIFLRSGSFQHALAALGGVAKSSVSRIIECCVNYTINLINSVIKFPVSTFDINISKQRFFDIAKFPNVLGLVDGTQIGIRSPNQDEAIYVCRKQFHSINTQVICGPDYTFYDIVAKYPGSTHDSFIYNCSGAKEKLYSGILGDGWLLGMADTGDSGYPLEERLLTPYLTETSEASRKYNKSHLKTRNLVERTIGIWKARFRCIDRFGGSLYYDPSKVCKIIAASAVLHNICVKKQIPLTEEDVLLSNQSPNQQDAPISNNSNLRRQASQLRDRVALSFL